MARAPETPPRLAASAGSPELGEPLDLDPGEGAAVREAAPPGGGRWTPDAVRVLFAGLFSVMAAWRGPHWAYTEEEGGPLIDPTTQVFNQTPGLRDVAPEHVALLIMVAGWGTMGARRLAMDKAIRQYVQEHPPTDAPADTPAAASSSSASPYGPNRLEGNA